MVPPPFPRTGPLLRRLYCGLLALPLLPAYAGPSPAVPPLLTLEYAYDRALATDESIAIAYVELRKAGLQPLSALTRLGPQLTGTVNVSRNFTPSASNTSTIILTGGQSTATSGSTTGAGSGSGTTSTPSVITATVGTVISPNSGSAQLNLQQPLFDATVFPAYHSAKLSVASSRLTYQSTVRDTLYAVANAFYAVLKDQQLVAVDKEALDLAGGQLELAQIRQRVGETILTDTLRARDTVAQARQTLVQARNTLQLARVTFANALALPTANFTLAEPPDYPPGIGLLEARVAQALQHREDLRIDALNIGIADEARRQVLAEYAPTLSANLTASQQLSGGPFGTISPNDTEVQGTVTATIPFFTGGQRELDLITARHNITKARLQFSSLVKTVRSDVATAWLQVRTLESSVAELKVQVNANSQNYQVLDRQYRAGLATSLDLQSALRDLNNSRAQLVSDTSDLEVARRNLDRQTATFEESRVHRAAAAPHVNYQPAGR